MEDADNIPTRSRSPIYDSPMFLRLREVLDLITPLNLTDSKDSSFSPAGCRSVHDIVRFCHEVSLRTMFGLMGEANESVVSEKLSFNIPISLHFIDIGGGLQDGLSSCDRITPESIRSVPMNAFWRGLSHPGINWSSAVGLDMRNLATLMSASAGGDLPGGDSYALVSHDYANISIKFGYHYCNVDSLCGEDASQNYVTMQFSGGVGSYYGKVLRIDFLSRVLTRLGFAVTVTGDTISASLKGFDQSAQEQALDQLGRLLASSRLLDVGIRSQEDIDRMAEAFFRSEYDYMNMGRAYALPGFYVPEGDWAWQADSEWNAADPGRIEVGRSVFVDLGQPVEPHDRCQVSTVLGQHTGLFLFSSGDRKRRIPFKRHGQCGSHAGSRIRSTRPVESPSASRTSATISCFG